MKIINIELEFIKRKKCEIFIEKIDKYITRNNQKDQCKHMNNKSYENFKTKAENQTSKKITGSNGVSV